MDLTQLLAFVVQNKASDLHLSGGNPAVLRVSGELKPLKEAALTGDTIKTMLYGIMSDAQRSAYERDLELDFAIALGTNARFRVNIFTNTQGTAAVFRTIPTQILTLEQLNAPPIFGKFAELHKGLVLVTGPTGSGKSTTLAAMIDYVNSNHSKHILTVEDPVEFVHSSKKGLINHREIGKDTKSFAKALKSALREDPDIILVGEMRDHETISLALTAAETGHLVMGTLHTASAAKTVDRIIDVFPAADKEMARAMLSGSLQAVVAQILLRKNGGGRVAAHEILVGTPAVRNLIRENRVPQLYSMMQMGQRFGMQTMKDSVEALIKSGTVTAEEGQRALQVAGAVDEDGGSKAPASGGGGTVAVKAPEPAAPPPPAKKEITF